MLKSIIVSVHLLVLSFFGFSQNIGINTTGASPDASALLDISSTNKGVLLPRITLSGTSDVVTIVSATTSLMVYNTATISDVTPGYYYWNGTISRSQ